MRNPHELLYDNSQRFRRANVLPGFVNISEGDPGEGSPGVASSSLPGVWLQSA